MKRLLLLAALFLLAANPFPYFQSIDSNPPNEVVKLIFIHHSTGENWLTDGYGNLGITLGQNNYYVSDTNYGWGPNAIGDRTDIPNWTEWFASADTPTYMNALFNENGQNSSYTRTLSDPGGENTIIMFKSCFPNSNLEGNPNDAAGTYEELTVAGAKYVYNKILAYFATRPDKLFIVVTAPPLLASSTSQQNAVNARAFNNWLVNDWLRENNYTLNNVAVFDFYNVLTSPDNHHRIVNGQIEHTLAAPGANTTYYPSEDDHPSAEGSRKATEEFVPMLNYFYNRWKADAPTKPLPPAPTVESGATTVAPSASLPNVLDDFEGVSLPFASGWESYFQDGTDTKLNCAKDNSVFHGGSASLKMEFDVTANSWATCGFYFDAAQNWQSSQGISFYVRADQASIPYDIDIFGGDPGARTTYIYRAKSATDWTLIEIKWDQFLRAEWEENPLTPFNPSAATGFALGLSTPENSRLSGTLWIDDLSIIGAAEQPPVAQPETTGTEETGFKFPSCTGALILPLAVIGALYRKKMPGK